MPNPAAEDLQQLSQYRPGPAAAHSRRLRKTGGDARGLFPGAANIYRPQRGETVADVDSRPPEHQPYWRHAMEYPRATTPVANAKYPIDLALDYLATAQPLMTPEWTSWRAAMRPPNCGHVAFERVSARQQSSLQQVVITPGAADNQFATSVQLPTWEPELPLSPAERVSFIRATTGAGTSFRRRAGIRAFHYGHSSSEWRRR